MSTSFLFVRTFFVFLSILFATIYGVNAFPFPAGLIGGLVGGFLFGMGLIFLEHLFKKFNLRSFNTALVGIFFGYLMGQALVLIVHGVITVVYSTVYHNQLIEIIEIGLFLFGIYLGLVLTVKAADEIYMSIPFVKFTSRKEKKKDLLLDQSVLSDSRIIDLALCGLLDYHLVVPRFLIRDLYSQAEHPNEDQREKSKRALDNLKTLEEDIHLGLRFNDTDFPEIRDLPTKMGRLARLMDANILTADVSHVQVNTQDGTRVINLHDVAAGLKPLMETGEIIRIKLQRHGKEPDQGVGYLEDGTMVVVNGGGSYVGQEIEANVLSVKQTSSGRMIFCNVAHHDPDHPSQS